MSLLGICPKAFRATGGKTFWQEQINLKVKVLKIYLKRILINPKMVIDFDLAFRDTQLFLTDLWKSHLYPCFFTLAVSFAFQDPYLPFYFQHISTLGQIDKSCFLLPLKNTVPPSIGDSKGSENHPTKISSLQPNLSHGFLLCWALIQCIQNNFTILPDFFIFYFLNIRGAKEVFQWDRSHSEVCMYIYMERQRLEYMSVIKDFIFNMLTTKL